MTLKGKEQQGPDATYQKGCDVLTEVGNKDTADKVHQMATKGNKAAHVFPHANLLCTCLISLNVGVFFMAFNADSCT